jgi:hypothetical protein
VPPSLASDLVEEIRIVQEKQPPSLQKDWEPVLKRLEEMRRPETTQLRKVAEIEVESFKRFEGALPSDMQNASNGKVIVLDNPNGWLATTVKLSAGVYRICVRGRGPKPDNDAFYLGLSGMGERRTYLSRPDWCESEPVIFALSESREYEIRLRYAEPNVVVDKVIIYSVGSSTEDAAAATRLGERNFVPNAGFEEVEKGMPIGWSLAREGIGACAIDDGIQHGGKYSVRLTPRIMPESKHHEHALQQPLTGPQLPPPGQYLFEAWVRVSRDYTGAMPTVGVNPYGKKTRNWYVARLDDGSPREEWLPLRVMAQFPDDTTSIYFQLKAYGDKGSVWFDEVSLRQVRP